MGGNQVADSAFGINRNGRGLLTAAAVGAAVAVMAGTVLAPGAFAQGASEIRGPLHYAAMRSEPAPEAGPWQPRTRRVPTRSNTMLRRSTARGSTT